MNDKFAKIMDICNKWTQYHKSLRVHWKTMTYDEVTDTLVKPIVDIIQSSTPTLNKKMTDEELCKKIRESGGWLDEPQSSASKVKE